MIVKKEVASLELPHEKTEPRTELSEYSTLIYGREKIGKTTFGSQFPEALFLFFEPGGKSLSVYGRDVYSWEEFKSYLTLLRKDHKFKTVIIDTVDIAYKMCYAYICKRLGVDHPAEEGFAKAWNMIRDEFQEKMAILMKLNRGVVLISHSTEKEIKKRYGDTEHRIITTMSKQAREVLEPMVDIWTYCEYGKDGGRQFVIRGDELISAGHRLQNNFKGIDKIPMGKNPKEAYENFVNAFNTNLVIKKLMTNSGGSKVKVRR